MTKAEKSVLKQGDLQLRCHSKASRSLRRQLYLMVYGLLLVEFIHEVKILLGVWRTMLKVTGKLTTSLEMML